ncbi:MAG TPA: kelch repeat-containing protein [Leptospiraceae bacterium]|nr:kelch repeat-containing protein [Leptospiraceae bacterium]HMW04417.1 kelch repeat-containing protein [Leptospiraceae bacterium]HMX31545.1 kelch repeat-containing protein [Leptospiraceae bacterium]HMY30603.1 kelch repeat-containing protein [Leptospiraceae bacterium]HMZ64455.1 kelch repeat-containing protein [Leptospiraceae bacterium]
MTLEKIVSSSSGIQVCVSRELQVKQGFSFLAVLDDARKSCAARTDISFLQWLSICIAFLFYLHCSNSPVNKGNETETLKLEITYVNEITTTSAIISWTCSQEAEGRLLYGKNIANNTLYTPFKSKLHRFNLSNLTQDTTYKYLAFCGNTLQTFLPLNFLLTFKTLKQETPPPSPPSMDEIYNRGIWILGGLTTSNSFISQVDVYDPVDDLWYPQITNIPTPRSHAGIVSYGGKIYVIGGLFLHSSNQIAATNLVEEFNPSTKTWRTMSNMPTSLQGFVIGVGGNSIYTIAGTTTINMASGTLLNTVYKFNPDIGATGTWSTLVSSSAISQKVDMGGCSINGVLYFNSGRLFSDGSVQSTNDGYIFSSNSTTGITETALNVGRHGAGSACYIPKSTDSFPSDSPAVLIVGGSTLLNTAQPVTSYIVSAAYDYYLPNSSGVNPNTTTSGPALPVGLYYPAVEFSYSKRRAYTFGGLLSSGVANDSFYYLDMANPVGGQWTIATTKMPIARYAHKAVILNR